MLSFRHGVVWVCALAFLIAGLLGAHLHLCFDGQEPATALHVLDGDHLDHHTDVEREHRDIDVDPLGKPLSKLYKSELPSPALLLLALLLVLPHGGAVPPLPRRLCLHLPPPRRWRPPLRAPPLLNLPR